MRELLQRYRTLSLIVAAIALPMIYFVLYGSTNNKQSTLPSRAVGMASAKIQSYDDFIVGSIANLWPNYINLVHAQNDNEKLRRENARLREENTGLQGILQQNDRLQRLVGFKQAHPVMKLAAARVVAADISPYFRVLRIRIVTDATGIEPEMPVVNAEGVIGRVERVYGRFCDVMLSIDPRSRIDILTQINRSRGIMTGTGDEKSYDAKISYLLSRDEVELGELVVTSGRGGLFPKELPVGRIKKIITKDVGLYQRVIIDPIVDFSRLEELYIIVDKGDTAPQ